MTLLHVYFTSHLEFIIFRNSDIKNENKLGGWGIIMTSLRTLRVEFRFLEKLFNRETLKKYICFRTMFLDDMRTLQFRKLDNLKCKNSNFYAHIFYERKKNLLIYISTILLLMESRRTRNANFDHFQANGISLEN